MKKTMQMSRKRNIKKEMFQPTTECVDSLTIDDITGQAVPESGTGLLVRTVDQNVLGVLFSELHFHYIPTRLLDLSVNVDVNLFTTVPPEQFIRVAVICKPTH